jgi:hypothetical protein
MVSLHYYLRELSLATYTTKLIPFHYFRLALSTESALIHKVGKFLFHEILDETNRLVKTFPRRTSDMEIKRWILEKHHEQAAIPYE